MSRKWS